MYIFHTKTIRCLEQDGKEISLLLHAPVHPAHDFNAYDSEISIAEFNGALISAIRKKNSLKRDRPTRHMCQEVSCYNLTFKRLQLFGKVDIDYVNYNGHG